MREAARTGHRVEVVEQDTQTETVFANPDGTVTSQIAQVPVRVPDEAGDLVPVDLSLHADAGRLTPTASAQDVSFSASGAGQLASLGLPGDASFGLGYDQDLGAPAVTDTAATYPVTGADPATVSVAATSTGFAAHVVLGSAPASAPTYSFPLALHGLHASLDDGQLLLRDDAGTVVAASAPLSMWDSRVDGAGDVAHRVPVDAALVDTPGGGTALRLTPSMDFLADPATVYPVTVDPDVSAVTRTSDTYVSSSPATATHGSEYRVRVGYDGTSKYRTLEMFNISRYLGHDVTSASLGMFEYYSPTCTAKRIDVRPVETTATVPAGINWPNQSNATSSVKWDTDATFNHGASGCAAGTQSFDVTRQVNGFTGGELASYHADAKQNIAILKLVADNEADAAVDQRFCSINYQASDLPAGSPCGNPDNRPTLSLTYAPDLGHESRYSMTDHQLNDHTTLSVNNENGNAVVKADDVHLTGLGQDLAVSRYYNSQAVADPAVPTSMGPGWSLSVGPDVWLEKKSPYAYDYHAPGGAVYGSFVRKATTVSSDPGNDYNSFATPVGGVDADLHDDTGDADPAQRGFTLTMHSSQLVYEFTDVDTTPGNDNLYLTKATDRSGNAITYDYVAGTHQLASITDTTGRSLTVAYTGGLLSAITDANGPTTRTWSYGYTGGRLTSYTDPIAHTTRYTYDDGTDNGGQPRIATITDPVNASGDHPKATVTVHDGQVTSVRYAANTADDPVGFDFTYSSTASARCASGDRASTDVHTTEPGMDVPTTYCFRDRLGDGSGTGMVHRVVDGNGNTRSVEYNVDMQPTTSTNAKGASTVATYGGTGLEDQLQKVSDPKDTGATAGSSATLTYATPSTKAGHDYLPSAKLDGNGVCTAYGYDDRGRLTDAYLDADDACSGQTDGRRYHQDLNSDGTVAASSDPNGSTSDDTQQTIYTYWQPGDTGYVTGTRGMVKTVRKPGGDCATGATRSLCTSYTYDGLSRITTVTDGLGTTTGYRYDKMDRVNQVRVDGKTASCTSADLAAGVCLTYDYDAEDNLVGRVGPQGATSFGFDRLNRQTSVATPDATTVTYGYNDDGKLTTLATLTGGVTTQSVAYGYDDGGQPVTVTDTHLGGTGTIYLGHDQNNRDDHVELPTSPTVTIDRTYTNAGRPKSITVQKSGTDPGDLPDWSIAYQKDGADTNQVQKITIDGSTTGINQVVSYAYNNFGQLQSADADTGDDYTYTNDAAANVTSEQAGTGTGATTYYGYDRAGQLCWQGTTTGTTLATTCPTAPSGDDTVNHDRAGNDTGTTAVPLTYNSYHQVATLDGRTQTYNDLGNNLRVTTAPGVSLLNSRVGVIARTTTAGVTHYVRSPSGTLLAEYGPGGTYYYATNNQGSVTTLIDSTGHRAAYYRYSPYGDPTVIDDNASNAGATNPWRYIGGYYDIEGDHYTKLDARYYNNHGHFTQPDPKQGTLSNPLSTLTYGYGGANPISNTDANGMTYFDVGYEGCFLACVNIGFGYDGDPDLTVGIGLGPDFGFSSYGGIGTGNNEGGQTSVTCQIVDVVGGYVTVGGSAAGGYGGGGGLAFGAGVGCSAGVSYTF